MIPTMVTINSTSSSLSSQVLVEDSFIVATKLLPAGKDEIEDTLVVNSSSDADLSSIFFYQEPSDAMFLVKTIRFPCHTKVLSKRCPMLYDILMSSVENNDGEIVERNRNAKKQRTQHALLSSSPSLATIPVAELSNIDPETFRVLLQYLYTNNISDFTAYYENEEMEDENKNDYVDEENKEEDKMNPMKSLQRLLIAADQYGCQLLKHNIEYKLYDEYLYLFTSVELFVWADAHSCALLKEKAMDRICKKDNPIEGWKMICESKRLIEELFVYSREGCHKVRYNNNNGCRKRCDDKSSLLLEDDKMSYCKIEYLRQRLSELGLDVEGTREMLEERLQPHLDVHHRHFLPTQLTKFSRVW